MPTPKQIIKRHFPHVTRIVDSERTLDVSVTPADTESAKPLDPENCALARACVRQKIADAAIIGMAYSYLIRGNTAVRYKTSVAVAREITAFDRHLQFAPGVDYKLSKVSASQQLGSQRIKDKQRYARKKTKKGTPEPVRTTHHRTVNVRVMRGLSPTLQ